ncbi:EamA family transporter [Paenibacillus donghaensis]|uniref:EamA family transporter n=1 Tax=Paenibacillus donghaensis TaxID=414771 RepID=UPI0018835F10|nr:EamA family transporter [Paenibacillus donghaensis]MBE9913832.1 EamA family transporter [Paenibacillus donghaensis]
MNKFKYSLLILIGACSYGILSSIMKLGMHEGFTVNQMLGGQYVFGWTFLLILMLVFSRKKLTLKQWLSLLAVGITMSGTSIFYGKAVERLPASIAVVLLFQFTWIGVLLEAAADRRAPSKSKIVSIFILIAGTLLAGGIIGETSGVLNVTGVVFGLLSAFTFALYMFVSGRVETSVPAFNKSFIMTSGSGVIVLSVFSPSFLWDGSMGEGLWKYGIALGFLGILIPVVFFAIGMPKVGSGMGAILGAAELPAAVVASVFIAHEHVSGLQWLGIVLIFIGIAVPQIRFSGKKKQPLYEARENSA